MINDMMLIVGKKQRENLEHVSNVETIGISRSRNVRYRQPFGLQVVQIKMFIPAMQKNMYMIKKNDL